MFEKATGDGMDDEAPEDLLGVDAATWLESSVDFRRRAAPLRDLPPII